MSERLGDRYRSCRLGILTDGEPSDEQRAASTAVEQLADVDVVDLATISSVSDVDQFDVLWWHRTAPVPRDPLPTADVLTEFVDGGGGLLLSLYALDAVDDLGIDPVTPDRVTETRVPNHAWAHQPGGLLVKSRFGETLLFDRCDTRRVYTQPAASESAPRLAYEKRIPRHGEVLASAVVGDEDCHSENTVVAWEHGEGRVLGVGQYVVFSEADVDHRDALCDLFSGWLRYLGGRDVPSITGRPKSAAELKNMRTSFGADHHRPQYHFTPPANWLNDPNGLIQWGGTYHFFYQYNPAGPYHGSIHWGHAVSDDLVHWEDRPVALTPDPSGPDEHGCWSGCAVDADGTPTVVYTGGSGLNQLPCLAEASDDSLDDWEKHPENPIIDRPPDSSDLLSNRHWNAEFRDHDVWREGDTWYHLIGSGIEDEGGTVLLYTSPDLLQWDYVGPILIGDAQTEGGMWECPDLLRFGDGDVLQVSNYDKVVYYSGRFDGENFEPKHRGVTDHGNYYAAQTMQDETGRHLSWGWIREDRPAEAQWDAGWSGAMSLPRELSLDDEGRLLIEPASELSRLRGEGHSLSDLTLTPDLDDPLEDFSGDTFEIEGTFELDGADAFELVVAASPDGVERTPIRYTGEELVLDRSDSSKSSDVETTPQLIEDVPGSENGLVTLRIFVDRSVVELFANDRASLSGRIYPTRADSTDVSCSAVGGDVQIHDLRIWPLEGTATPTPETESVTSPETVR